MDESSFWLGWISFGSVHSPAASLAERVLGVRAEGRAQGGRAGLHFVLAELWPRAGSRTRSSGRLQVAHRRRNNSAGHFFWNVALHTAL